MINHKNVKSLCSVRVLCLYLLSSVFPERVEALFPMIQEEKSHCGCELFNLRI